LGFLSLSFPQTAGRRASAFARFFDPTNKDFRCARPFTRWENGLPQNIVKRFQSAEVFGLSAANGEGESNPHNAGSPS